MTLREIKIYTSEKGSIRVCEDSDRIKGRELLKSRYILQYKSPSNDRFSDINDLYKPAYFTFLQASNRFNRMVKALDSPNFNITKWKPQIQS